MMSKLEEQQQFDIEALRRRVSDGVSSTPDPHQPVELNPLARQVAEQFSDDNYSPSMLIGQYRLLEYLLMLAVGLSAELFFGPAERSLAIRFSVIGAGAALTVLLLQLADAYQIPSIRAPSRTRMRLIGSWLLGVTISVCLLLAADGAPTTTGLIFWVLGGTVILLVERFLIAFAIRNWSRNGIMERRAIIVGGGQPAKELARALERQPDNDIRICGIFDDRGSDRSPEVVAGYPKLGTFAELVEFSRLARIDMLIIALPPTAEDRILQLIRKLWVLPVDIRLAAHANRLRFRPRAYSHVGAVPMFDIFDKPIRDWDSVAKRAFDIFFSLLAIVFLWPVMLGVALAVKFTSPGPILFVQKRHGFNNEIINVLKFRSMYTHLGDPSAKLAVTKGDARVTPVGRFIRKSSLDELPQFFNVLRGDLSLVGPRPHAVQAQTGDRKYVDVVESYFARHRVKPGVTGWAQINGLRGEIDTDEKIRGRINYDLDYIENWSILFDLKILFLTPIRLLNTDNAY